MGTPLWNHNQYRMVFNASHDSRAEFNLDDFLLERFLPFNTRSASQLSVNPSYFSKTIHLHQHVTKVTSSEWPVDILRTGLDLNKFAGTMIGAFLKRKRRISEYKYGVLVLAR